MVRPVTGSQVLDAIAFTVEVLPTQYRQGSCPTGWIRNEWQGRLSLQLRFECLEEATPSDALMPLNHQANRRASARGRRPAVLGRPDDQRSDKGTQAPACP